jgi:hypothetical protein
MKRCKRCGVMLSNEVTTIEIKRQKYLSFELPITVTREICESCKDKLQIWFMEGGLAKC